MKDDFLPIEITLREKLKAVIQPMNGERSDFSILYCGYQEQWIAKSCSSFDERLCLQLANALLETVNKMKRLRGEVEILRKAKSKPAKRIPTLIEQFGLEPEK